MAYDKTKLKQVTIYVPREILDEIDRFHIKEGRPRMKMSAKIVNLLQVWYDKKVEEEKGEDIRAEGE